MYLLIHVFTQLLIPTNSYWIPTIYKPCAWHFGNCKSKKDAGAAYSDYAPREETHFNQRITHVNAKVLLGQILWRGGPDCSIPCGCPTQTSGIPFTYLVSEPIPPATVASFCLKPHPATFPRELSIDISYRKCLEINPPSSPRPITDLGGSTDASMFASMQDRLQFNLPYRFPLQIGLNQDFAQNHILVHHPSLSCFLLSLPVFLRALPQ